MSIKEFIKKSIGADNMVRDRTKKEEDTLEYESKVLEEKELSEKPKIKMQVANKEDKDPLAEVPKVIYVTHEELTNENLRIIYQELMDLKAKLIKLSKAVGYDDIDK